MRVLITGIRGFTGRHLKSELEACGHQIFGVKSDLTDLSAILDEVGAFKPEGVVHLAGISNVGHRNINAFHDINVNGTQNLLSALSEYTSGLKCILLASSANIYGNGSKAIITESQQPNPVNAYAISKLAMENMARSWMDRLPIVIARPFNYTGVGQSLDFLIPKIIDHYSRHSPSIELGNIHISRDFSDVRDVAAIYRKLLEGNVVDRTLNICSGRAYSLSDVLRVMAEITGYKITVNINPAYMRDNEVDYLAGDPSALYSCIGFTPSIPLNETLNWMYTTSVSYSNNKPSLVL